jgi:hypothetical protein
MLITIFLKRFVLHIKTCESIFSVVLYHVHVQDGSQRSPTFRVGTVRTLVVIREVGGLCHAVG